MSDPEFSRYAIVSRRAMLKALGGAAVALTGAGCAASDAEVFAGTIAEPVPTTLPPTTTTTTTTTTPPTTTEAPTTTTEAPTTTEATPPTSEATEAATAGEQVAAAVPGELIVSFTYTQSPGGKNEFPYVAVWIEDATGELVHTVALFYELGRRGQRWLDHLDRWWAGSGGVIDTVTSATRPPGTYAVAWDGVAEGQVVPTGDYFVCIESARENGPVSLVRELVPFTGAAAAGVLPDDGELSAATYEIVV